MGRFEMLMQAFASGTREPVFPPGLVPDKNGLVAIGGVLSTDLLLEAYAKGYFPWTGEHPIPWYSPQPRLVLFPAQFHLSRSLRKWMRKHDFHARFDQQFSEVMRQCATIPRGHEDGTWITPNMRKAYTELHALGIAHSVEIYQNDSLCGGLYGLTLGRAFFGESMFSAVPNGSKMALYHLCQLLLRLSFDFIDCQAVTPHLLSLGALPFSRKKYERLLASTLEHPSRHEPWSLSMPTQRPHEASTDPLQEGQTTTPAQTQSATPAEGRHASHKTARTTPDKATGAS